VAESGYPVVLNGDGCKFGQRLMKQTASDLEAEREERNEKIEALQTSIELLGKKVDRLLWALVTAAVSFGSLALALALNLALSGKL